MTREEAKPQKHEEKSDWSTSLLWLGFVTGLGVTAYSWYQVARDSAVFAIHPEKGTLTRVPASDSIGEDQR